VLANSTSAVNTLNLVTVPALNFFSCRLFCCSRRFTASSCTSINDRLTSTVYTVRRTCRITSSMVFCSCRTDWLWAIRAARVRERPAPPSKRSWVILTPVVQFNSSGWKNPPAMEKGASWLLW